MPGRGRCRRRSAPVRTSAVERLVRAAWTLDAAGDTGNRSEVEQGYSALASAAREVRRRSGHRDDANDDAERAADRGLKGLRYGGVVCAIAAGISVQRVDAHKPVTSKYTYSEDVYPIVKEHCGSCHAPGGVAPMSLLTYEAARPWAESIRLELTAGHMPPWFGDPSVAPLKDVHKLSPRDVDVVLTWVSGGTPPGPGKPVPDVAIRNVWRRGRPDMTLQSAGVVHAAGGQERRHARVRAAGGRTIAIA